MTHIKRSAVWWLEELGLMDTAYNEIVDHDVDSGFLGLIRFFFLWTISRPSRLPLTTLNCLCANALSNHEVTATEKPCMLSLDDQG